ncbi:hypothetical protein DB346_00645 [Verrucomicrobia bacterium LW23]|nr:hypothetical protein DB346_00645 [Verrucomicrobia bacterium LW23]
MSPGGSGQCFAKLNLHANPFGELKLRERMEVAIPLPKAEEALRNMPPGPFALQFIGEPGRGKTTHMLALRLRFPTAPYIYIPEVEPRPKLPIGPRIPGLQAPQPVLFVDETQRLSPTQRRRLFAPPGLLNGAPHLLICGTHEDHSAEFRAAGRGFASIRIQGVDPQRLAQIFQRRIDLCTRDPDVPAPHLSSNAIAWLISTYADDIRAMEHHLYACFQRLRHTGPVTPGDLAGPPCEASAHRI